MNSPVIKGTLHTHHDMCEGILYRFYRTIESKIKIHNGDVMRKWCDASLVADTTAVVVVVVVVVAADRSNQHV